VADSYTHAGTIEGYSYPPFSLLLTTIAWVVTGETRWAHLVLTIAGGILLMAMARRRTVPGDPWADLLVVLLLFHPRGLFTLEQGWGEPLALPFLAGFVLLLDIGRRRDAALVLGFLCALKQHFILYLPFAALMPGFRARGVLIAAGVVAATYLPFALWAPLALWRDLVVFHLMQPFRPDSLSVGALFASFGHTWPSSVGFVGAAIVLVAAPLLNDRSRTGWFVAGPLIASCISFAVLYVFGGRAFCNYYYLVSATALVAAAAATSVAPEVGKEQSSGMIAGARDTRASGEPGTKSALRDRSPLPSSRPQGS
jgi:hypothetical protein